MCGWKRNIVEVRKHVATPTVLIIDDDDDVRALNAGSRQSACDLNLLQRFKNSYAASVGTVPPATRLIEVPAA